MCNDFNTFKEKYVYEHEDEYYVFHTEEVGDWCNARELNRKLNAAYGGDIPNCGYVLCNNEMLELMYDKYFTPNEAACDDGEAIFYHPSW